MDDITWKLVQEMGLLSHVTTTEVYCRLVEHGFANAALVLSGEDFTILGEEQVTRCHGLMFGAVYQEAGRLRDSSDEFFFLGDVTCAAESLPHELFLLEAQQRELLQHDLFSRLLLLAFTHARLVFLQPCCDGNKRVARLLTDFQARSLIGTLDLAPWPRTGIYGAAVSQVRAFGDLSSLMRLIAERSSAFEGIRIEDSIPLPFA